MKSKERVMRAINHEETDRIPFSFPGASDGTTRRLMSFVKVSDYEDLMRLLNVDTRLTNWMIYKGEKRYYNGEDADHWGITPKAYNDGDSSNQCPLRDVTSIDEVESYQWPSPCDFYGNHIDSELDAYKDYAIIGGLWAPIYHNFAWLCGYENALVNLHIQPEVSKAIIRHITDFWVGYAEKLLELGKGRFSMLDCYNDFGTQIDLIMSPDMFREFFKPELKRLFDVIKSYGAKVFFHSCGSIAALIPDLIEIGVDVLDPVQANASGMSPEILKNKYGNQITFHGGIDTQHLLPEGTVEEVRLEVNRVVRIMSRGGGYILSGSQMFEDDIPVENITAMYID